MLALQVAGGEDVVPEEGGLLLQGAPGISHAVQPDRGGCYRVLPEGAVVAGEDGLVDRLEPLRVKQVLYDVLVWPERQRIELLACDAEAGAAHQVGDERAV